MLTSTDLKLIRTVVREEIAPVDKRLTKFQAETAKNFKKLEKKMDYVDKTLDKEILADRKRITRIEDHLELQPLQA